MQVKALYRAAGNTLTFSAPAPAVERYRKQEPIAGTSTPVPAPPKIATAIRASDDAKHELNMRQVDCTAEPNTIQLKSLNQPTKQLNKTLGQASKQISANT